MVRPGREVGPEMRAGVLWLILWGGMLCGNLDLRQRRRPDRCVGLMDRGVPVAGEISFIPGLPDVEAVAIRWSDNSR
jgi:hypothetical protein